MLFLGVFWRAVSYLPLSGYDMCSSLARRLQVLQELSPQGLHAVFERFRGILHEGQIDKRVQYTIETLFAVRKSGFSDHPAVPPELDLVERDDQITFEMGLEDKLEKEEMLDIFRMDDK